MDNAGKYDPGQPWGPRCVTLQDTTLLIHLPLPKYIQTKSSTRVNSAVDKELGLVLSLVFLGKSLLHPVSLNPAIPAASQITALVQRMLVLDELGRSGQGLLNKESRNKTPDASSGGIERLRCTGGRWERVI